MPSKSLLPSKVGQKLALYWCIVQLTLGIDIQPIKNTLPLSPPPSQGEAPPYFRLSVRLRRFYRLSAARSFGSNSLSCSNTVLFTQFSAFW